MNKENTAQIYRDFPQLFRGRNKSIKENLMPFGFDHNDGWFQLVYDLSAKIDTYAKEKGLTPEVVQVKEKFGSLRYYLHGGDEFIYDLICKVEEASTHICEDCGRPAKVRSRGRWYRTLCSLCAFEQSYDEAKEDTEEDKLEDEAATSEEDTEEWYVHGGNFKCIKCGWIHLLNLAPRYKDYGWRCFRCGAVGKENFVEAKQEEMPFGSTIQQVNTLAENTDVTEST